MEIYIVIKRTCGSDPGTMHCAYANKSIAESVAARLTAEKGYYKEDEWGKDWRTWFEVEPVRLMGLDAARMAGGK